MKNKTPYFHFLLLFTLSSLLFLPMNCFARAVPIPPVDKKIKKKALKKSAPRKTHWSFKKPAYSHKKPLNFRQKRHPDKIACEGPSMGEGLLIFLLLLLLWAIPTGLLVLFGLIFSIVWLWILGLVLFGIPIVFLAVLLLIVAFSN